MKNHARRLGSGRCVASGEKEVEDQKERKQTTMWPEQANKNDKKVFYQYKRTTSTLPKIDIIIHQGEWMICGSSGLHFWLQQLALRTEPLGFLGQIKAATENHMCPKRKSDSYYYIEGNSMYNR